MEPSRRERAREKAGETLVAAAEIIRDSVVSVVTERLTRPTYRDAEVLAMDVLNKRIDVLAAKANPTQRDSQMIALLKEVRSEIQTALEERWNNREAQTATESA